MFWMTVFFFNLKIKTQANFCFMFFMQAWRRTFYGVGRSTMRVSQSLRIFSNKRQGFPQQRMADRHISTYLKDLSFCWCSFEQRRRTVVYWRDILFRMFPAWAKARWIFCCIVSDGENLSFSEVGRISRRPEDLEKNTFSRLISAEEENCWHMWISRPEWLEGGWGQCGRNLRRIYFPRFCSQQGRRAPDMSETITRFG